MNRKDYLNISALVIIAIAIFYPLFYSEYAYTDDWYALWQHETGKGTHVLILYGRYLTDVLTNWLFSSVNARTVDDLVYIRLFSLCGWIVCIPVWYLITRKIVLNENLPRPLIFFSTLYLICTPPFAIYVGWASCFEQFIANTAGLISGYILYSSIKYQDDRISVSFLPVVFSIAFGLVSLFTYQNGFGCFLIPFLLHLVTTPKSFRRIFIGIGFYLFTYVVYYLLFKYSLKVNHIGPNQRTIIGVDVFPKLKFLFSKPLATSFHYTYLFNENSIVGFVLYLFIFGGWLTVDFVRRRLLPIAARLKIVFLTFSMIIFIYIPSLIVKEIYSSNRTVFALNMAIFFFTAATLLNILKNYKQRVTIVSILSVLFVINAWYNFNKQFLGPVKNEYHQVRNFIEQTYDPTIDTVYFIRPAEDLFVRKYGITRSWDEFGMPSTFPSWLSEFFVKQVILEKTQDHRKAESIIIKQWPGKKEFSGSALPLSPKIMLVDVEKILNR